MVSVTKIRLDRRKSTRLFKRIICDDTRSRSLANAREALSRPTAVSSSDGSIDLSHLEALPGPSCVSTALQLKRERSLRARFAEANGNYHNISNTWLVRGFPSSSPLTPATQSVSVARLSRSRALRAAPFALTGAHVGQSGLTDPGERTANKSRDSPVRCASPVAPPSQQRSNVESRGSGRLRCNCIRKVSPTRKRCPCVLPVRQ